MSARCPDCQSEVNFISKMIKDGRRTALYQCKNRPCNKTWYAWELVDIPMEVKQEPTTSMENEWVQ